MKVKKKPKEAQFDYINRAANELKNKGNHIDEIAAKLGVDQLTIYNAIVPKNSKITTEAERNYMILLREQGKSYNEIAEMIGRSKSCVRDRVASPAKFNGRHGQSISDRDLLKIIKWYRAGKTASWIAKQVGVSRHAVIYRLKKAGVYQKNGYKVPLTALEKAKIKNMHYRKVNNFSISAEIGRDTNTVSRYITEEIKQKRK